MEKHDTEVHKTLLEKNKDILIEQFKQLMNYLTKNSERREDLNKFFYSTVTIITTAYSILHGLDLVSFKKRYIFPLLLMVGVGICIFWILSLFHFRYTKKILVNNIKRFEKFFPHAPFTTLFEDFKNHAHYNHLEIYEICIPLLLMGAFVTLFVIALL